MTDLAAYTTNWTRPSPSLHDITHDAKRNFILLNMLAAEAPTVKPGYGRAVRVRFEYNDHAHPPIRHVGRNAVLGFLQRLINSWGWQRLPYALNFTWNAIDKSVEFHQAYVGTRVYRPKIMVLNVRSLRGEDKVINVDTLRGQLGLIIDPLL